MKGMMDFFDDLEKKSRALHPVNPEDYYGDDELLYCGKCHTPKEKWYNMPALVGGRKKEMIPCECEKTAVEAENAEREKREREDTINRLKSIGFPDRKSWDCTFEHDDMSNPKLSAICRNYADNFAEMKKKQKGLLFFGPIGTGKTFLATCIANQLIETELRRCKVTTFSRIATEIWNSEDKATYLDSMSSYDLLVIDDLGTERKTSYMDEMVYTFVDSRYRSGLPMIITTNMTADQLKNPDNMMMQRVVSRLMERCIFYPVARNDRRPEIMIKDFPEISEILERERGESE